MFSKKMLALGCLFWASGIGAQNKFNYQNIVPPSPEVAAIAKYTDIPVSYSTGVPQISIPLFVAASGSLQVPISLSYNASGIRVEEASTWVGLGWNLNYGGSLSRVVRGLPDETDVQGYMKTPAYRKINYLRPLALNTWDKWQAFEEIEDRLDLEADIFNFSVMGYSGKFCYDQASQQFIMIPLQNIRIENDAALQWFILTLPNGIKCYFGNSADGLRSSTERTLVQYSTSWENGNSAATTSSGVTHHSMWSLMDIVSPTGQSISFFYDHKTVTDFGRGSETKDFIADGVGQPYWKHRAGFQYQRIDKPFISKITTAQSDVYFVSETPRQDVFNLESGSLDSVIIRNKRGTVIRSFAFGYDYTTSQDVSNLWGLYQFAEVARKRLRLRSLKESGSISLPPYEFTYNPTPLPNRLSASQDYWGFYNGKANGDFLMPRWHTGGYTGLPEGYTIGANREIDTVLAQAGLLVSVKYPTGGATRYHFEQNRASIMYYKTMGNFERPDLIDKHLSFPGLHDEEPNATYYSNTFSISNPGTKVNIKAQLDGCAVNYNTATCPHHITIKGVTDPSFTYTFSMSTEFYLELPQGEYEIINQITPGTTPVPTFNVELNWREIPDPNNFLVGGVRIAKIVTADGDGSGISRSYSYDMGVNTSSGIVYGCPVHVYNVPLDYYGQLAQAQNGGSGGTIKEVVKAQPGDGMNPPHNLNHVTYVAQSAVPLTPDGQLVHYMMVTEYFDSTRSSFKNEYIYDNDWDYYTDFKNDVPLPTPMKDWRKSLKQKKVYEQFNGNYRVIMEEQYFYKPYDEASYLSGMKCTYIPRVVASSNPMEPKHLGDISFYEIDTEWFLLDSSVTIQHSYTDGYASLANGIKQHYNDKRLLKESVSSDSRRQQSVSRIYYPSDYDASLTGTLVSKNMLELPVKQEQIVNGNLVSGIVMEYGPDGLPFAIHNYEKALAQPGPPHSPMQMIPADYEAEALLTYSGGNLLQVYKTGALPHEIRYEWDVSANAPILELSKTVGGSYAYTSFEYGGESIFWSGIKPSRLVDGGVTGRSGYMLDEVLSTTTIPAVEYVVTYWTTNATAFGVNGNVVTPVLLRSFEMNGETWRCFQHRVTGETLIGVRGTGKIDELRLYPAKGQMRTFTYDALIGTTSVCDDNNRILYYEYDGLGRLSLIRDQDRYIAKKFCYNYQGQQSECAEAYNLLPPPDPCASCSGIDKMCINNICYTGKKVLLSSVRISGGSWKCTYIYEFMDGIYTSPEFEEIVNGICPL